LQFDADVVTLDKTGNPVINSNVAGSYIPLPYNISKYANGNYGWNFGTKWSLHTIVEAACAYLDSKSFSWAPYTQGDNVVNLLIISAGFDYRFAQTADVANPEDNYLLATSYSGAGYVTRSGALANTYTFCSEHTEAPTSTPVMAHIGECVHEYGHGLGVPDLYDLSYQTTGVGYFDLMGYGLYGAGSLDGSQPIGMGAWVKESLGWTSPQVVSNTSVIVLSPSSQSPNNVLKVFPSGKNSSVYYLVENRQSIDKWDKNFAEQYTNGVVIWKVDPANALQFTRINHINSYPDDKPLVTNCPPFPSVVVMEADGNQAMSTIGFSLGFGSASDIWQRGSQFVIDAETSIQIVDFDANGVTLNIVVDGQQIPDLIKNSANANHPVQYLTYLLVLLSLYFIM
jgi:M6 family metalloprotease-like protein